jgi:hypothetical protein
VEVASSSATALSRLFSTTKIWPTHLFTHKRQPEQTFNRVTPVNEMIIYGITALDLALCRAYNEFSKQVEFSPMNLGSIVDMCVWISFMCPDKILNMDLSVSLVRKVIADQLEN